MKILVTGGAGYLGSILSSELLKTGHEVRVLDNLMYGARALGPLMGEDDFSFIRGDVRDPGTVRRALDGVHAVVHLAAVVGDPACTRYPDLAQAVNRQGSLNLLNAAVAAGVSRFVFASTCSNYGRIDPAAAATEDTPLCPLSLYAETKVDVERALLALPREPMCATVLRFSTLYGLSPRMRFDLTVNEFTLHLKVNGRLTVFGEGYWRPYVHVRDAARAVVRVLAADVGLIAGEVFNVGDSHENYRKSDVVELIRSRVGEVHIDFVKKVEDPRDYRVSFDRIARVLGYQITRRVPNGIEEIVNALEAGVIEEPFGCMYKNLLPDGRLDWDANCVAAEKLAYRA